MAVGVLLSVAGLTASPAGAQDDPTAPVQQGAAVPAQSTSTPPEDESPATTETPSTTEAPTTTSTTAAPTTTATTQPTTTAPPVTEAPVEEEVVEEEPVEEVVEEETTTSEVEEPATTTTRRVPSTTTTARATGPQSSLVAPTRTTAPSSGDGNREQRIVWIVVGLLCVVGLLIATLTWRYWWFTDPKRGYTRSRAVMGRALRDDHDSEVVRVWENGEAVDPPEVPVPGSPVIREHDTLPTVPRVVPRDHDDVGQPG
jgi:hypothetical protein